MRKSVNPRMVCLPAEQQAGGLYLCMAGQKKHREQYDIELPQSIIDSFARFLVPEIRKLYTSEEGQKELEEWKKKYPDKSEE